jgi:hypothetical protein
MLHHIIHVFICRKNIKNGEGMGKKWNECELFLPFCPSPAIPSNKYKKCILDWILALPYT